MRSVYPKSLAKRRWGMHCANNLPPRGVFTVRNRQIMHGMQILPSSGDLGFSAARRLPGKTGCAPASVARGWGIRKGDPCGSPFLLAWYEPAILVRCEPAILAGCETIGPDGTVGLPVGHRPASSDRVRQPRFPRKRRRRCQAGSSRSLHGRSSRSRGSSDPR